MQHAYEYDLVTEVLQMLHKLCFEHDFVLIPSQ